MGIFGLLSLEAQQRKAATKVSRSGFNSSLEQCVT